MTPNKEDFAKDWIDSWDSHDLDKILSHYDDSFSFSSPRIAAVLGTDEEALEGKEKIRHYWALALESAPDLRFELIDVTEGIDCIAIYYKSVRNKNAIEVFFFNEAGKVEKSVASYT